MFDFSGLKQAYIIEIFGLLFALLILKRLLRLRDTLILILSTLSMAMESLCVGLAQSSGMLYASLGAGCLHAIVNPLLYTFLSCLADSSEVIKLIITRFL